MARTAGQLSQEELRSYHPWQTLQRYHKDPDVSRRWDLAWHIARTAARLPREHFGATKVVVFGSLVHRAWFTPWSDVDLAVWGISPEKYFRAIGAVRDFGAEFGFKLDVIDPAECAREMLRSIQSEGTEL